MAEWQEDVLTVAVKAYVANQPVANGGNKITNSLGFYLREFFASSISVTARASG